MGGEDTNRRLNLPPIESFLGETFDLALGFRRLAILDLSPAGHQPMSSADGRFWIVFNGQIYNHVELRSELSDHGHQFRSATDTEVLLAAYEKSVPCLHDEPLQMGESRDQTLSDLYTLCDGYYRSGDPV